MSVRLNLKLQKGWKTKDSETRGEVQVVEFLNERTNELLFTYAPKWQDIPLWLTTLSQMCELEKIKIKKKIREIKDMEENK